MLVQWSVPFLHSEEDSSLNPDETFLCGVCVLCEFSLETLVSSQIPKTGFIGFSKLPL